MKLVLARIFSQVEVQIPPGYEAKPSWIANFIGPAKDLPIRARRLETSRILHGLA